MFINYFLNNQKKIVKPRLSSTSKLKWDTPFTKIKLPDSYNDYKFLKIRIGAAACVPCIIFKKM